MLVANRPFYAVIGVTLAGERDILGLWAGTAGEGAKFWMSVLTDLRNRGVKGVSNHRPKETPAAKTCAKFTPTTTTLDMRGEWF
jgi:transposase-like protein